MKWFKKPYIHVYLYQKWDALHDLASFVQFKKHEKTRDKAEKVSFQTVIVTFQIGKKNGCMWKDAVYRTGHVYTKLERAKSMPLT